MKWLVQGIAGLQLRRTFTPIRQSIYLYVRKVVFVKYGYFFAEDPNPENNGARFRESSRQGVLERTL